MNDNPFDDVVMPDVERFERLQAELERSIPSRERLEEMLAEADEAIANSNPVGRLLEVITSFRNNVLAALQIVGGGGL